MRCNKFVANIELINKTCELAGIERLTPDNIDTKDMAVWKSFTDSTLGIFQFESDSASAYLKQLFSDNTLKNIRENVGDIDYIDILSMANGAIRPSGDSYRHQLADGLPKDNGHDALNELFKETLGFCIFQEQIMTFLTSFANHSGAESDSVRRGLAKKEGTEQFLPKIESGFISYMVDNYGETEDHARELLQSLLKVISDASDYGFSVNHSSPYSYTGYAGAWLRYHYPLEFLTTILNVMKDEKASKIMAFANKKKFEVKPIMFGHSRADYAFNKEEGAVYKGIQSIKYLNYRVSEELYTLAQENEYDKNDWVGLVKDILDKTSAQSNQMEILITLDFFKEFGEKEVLLEIYKTMSDNKKPNFDLYPEFAPKEVDIVTEKTHKRTGVVTRKIETKTIKKPLKYSATLKEKTIIERLKNLREYEIAVRLNPPPKMSLYEQITFEREKLGYAVTTMDVSPQVSVVLELNNLQYTPKVTLYQVSTGREYVVKVKKTKFWSYDQQLLYKGDIVKVLDVTQEDGWKKEENPETGKQRWVRNPNVKELHLQKVQLLRKSKERESEQVVEESA